jgi:copper chaperone CopZ
MGAYRISQYLQGLLQLRVEARDRALNGTIGGTSGTGGLYSYLNSSGGVVAYLAPQLAVSVFGTWMFSAQYNLPVYKNIYGDEQLTNRHSVAINLSRAFDFSGSGVTDVVESPDDSSRVATMLVRGNCEMCKDRIEAVALSTAHVLKASWDADKETLTLTYDAPSLDLEKIAKAIAKSGHDAEGHAAPDDVYARLPACCHYRD